MAATAEQFETHLSHDRLGFAFCIALALHAAIILGISFNREDHALAATKLEITLAQHNTEKAPDEADFLAQSNQQGSGTLEEKAMLTARERADFQDTKIRDVNPQQQMASEKKTASSAKVTSNSAQDKKSRTKTKKQAEALKERQEAQVSIMQRSLEIASLEARLDVQQQAYAKRPRIRRLTSLATKQSDDAQYLYKWRAKIEAIGNKNYPAQAKQQKNFGDLRLLVALLPNGAVHQVKILESSGHKILDEAAIRIVHLAAPYDPFPREMSSKVDILEIIRTWQFQQNRLISSS